MIRALPLADLLGEESTRHARSIGDPAGGGRSGPSSPVIAVDVRGDVLRPDERPLGARRHRHVAASGELEHA